MGQAQKPVAQGPSSKLLSLPPEAPLPELHWNRVLFRGRLLLPCCPPRGPLRQMVLGFLHCSWLSFLALTLCNYIWSASEDPASCSFSPQSSTCLPVLCNSTLLNMSSVSQSSLPGHPESCSQSQSSNDCGPESPSPTPGWLMSFPNT